MAPTPATVEDYLATLPEDVQPVVREVRRRILAAVPAATEKISYAIPAVVLDGRSLISYGAWKSHLGLYPVPVGAGDLEAELVPYSSTKDALRFRWRDPMPYDLIARLVNERAASLPFDGLRERKKSLGSDSAIT